MGKHTEYTEKDMARMMKSYCKEHDKRQNEMMKGSEASKDASIMLKRKMVGDNRKMRKDA